MCVWPVALHPFHTLIYRRWHKSNQTSWVKKWFGPSFMTWIVMLHYYLISTPIPRTQLISPTFRHAKATSSLRGLPLFNGERGFTLIPFASLENSSFRWFLLVRGIPEQLRLVEGHQCAQGSWKLNESWRYYRKLSMHFSIMWFHISKLQFTAAKISPYIRGPLMNLILKWFLRYWLS